MPKDTKTLLLPKVFVSLCLKIRKLWVITKPGLEKVWALRIKKGCVSVLTQPLSFHLITFII